MKRSWLHVGPAARLGLEPPQVLPACQIEHGWGKACNRVQMAAPPEFLLHVSKCLFRVEEAVVAHPKNAARRRVLVPGCCLAGLRLASHDRAWGWSAGGGRNKREHTCNLFRGAFHSDFDAAWRLDPRVRHVSPPAETMVYATIRYWR